MKRLIYSAALHVMLLPAIGSAQDCAAGLATADAGDCATALNEWLSLAGQGDPYAQYNLRVMYANGFGLPQNYISAHICYNVSGAMETPMLPEPGMI